MRILIVRFRQMGDTILTTVVMNTLKATFPHCTIDVILNENICSLFDGYPSIDKIIPFSKNERHNSFKYIRKVWQTVRHTHYDVIIDMRSTISTMLFALFSPKTKYRIGLKKSYTRLAFNYIVNPCQKDESMIEHNLAMLKPLEAIAQIKYDKQFSLFISQAEKENYKEYLLQKGISFDKPILLIGVTAKLAHKTWSEENMKAIIRKIINTYPNSQLIFNYAPGEEENNARKIYTELGKPQHVFIDIQAKSQRELVALASIVTFYFGNEGGARHIVHACGKPSFVVCTPQISIKTWIPQNNIPAKGIYNTVSEDIVWEKMQQFIVDNNIKIK